MTIVVLGAPARNQLRNCPVELCSDLFCRITAVRDLFKYSKNAGSFDESSVYNDGVGYNMCLIAGGAVACQELD